MATDLTDRDLRWVSMEATTRDTIDWARQNDIPLGNVYHASLPLLYGMRMTEFAVHRAAGFYERPDAAKIEDVVNRNLIKSGLEPLHPFFGPAETFSEDRCPHAGDCAC